MDWFADSEARQHMTDQLSMLTNFTPVDSGTWQVNGIGGARLYVLGQGDVKVSAAVN